MTKPNMLDGEVLALEARIEALEKQVMAGARLATAINGYILKRTIYPPEFGYAIEKWNQAQPEKP